MRSTNPTSNITLSPLNGASSLLAHLDTGKSTDYPHEV
jgi:hypothetical protein